MSEISIVFNQLDALTFYQFIRCRYFRQDGLSSILLVLQMCGLCVEFAVMGNGITSSGMRVNDIRLRMLEK